MERCEVRLATAGTFVLKKGSSGKQIFVHDIAYTATATSTVAFTDGKKTITLDAAVGSNWVCKEFVFEPDADVTITVTGGTVSIFLDYGHK